MIEHVHFLRHEKSTRRFVIDKSVVIPAIPESADDGNIFRIPSGRGSRRDHIPADPALADEVERGKAAGEIVKFMLSARRRRHETNPSRKRGQGRGQRRRLEGHGLRRQLSLRTARLGVGEEHEIKRRVLSFLCLRHEVADLERAWRGVFCTPSRRMVPERTQ